MKLACKTFYAQDDTVLEHDVNCWLEKHEKITIVNMVQSQSTRTGNAIAIVLTVFFQFPEPK